MKCGGLLGLFLHQGGFSFLGKGGGGSDGTRSELVVLGFSASLSTCSSASALVKIKKTIGLRVRYAPPPPHRFYLRVPDGREEDEKESFEGQKKTMRFMQMRRFAFQIECVRSSRCRPTHRPRPLCTRRMSERESHPSGGKELKL